LFTKVKSSTLTEPSVVDLKHASNLLEKLQHEAPCLTEQISTVKTLVFEMSVALCELEELREYYALGFMTKSMYLAKRTKLVSEFSLAKERVNDLAIRNSSIDECFHKEPTVQISSKNKILQQIRKVLPNLRFKEHQVFKYIFKISRFRRVSIGQLR
jgi:hypothetical protein